MITVKQLEDEFIIDQSTAVCLLEQNIDGTLTAEYNNNNDNIVVDYLQGWTDAVTREEIIKLLLRYKNEGGWHVAYSNDNYAYFRTKPFEGNILEVPKINLRVEVQSVEL